MPPRIKVINNNHADQIEPYRTSARTHNSHAPRARAHTTLVHITHIRKRHTDPTVSITTNNYTHSLIRYVISLFIVAIAAASALHFVTPAIRRDDTGTCLVSGTTRFPLILFTVLAIQDSNRLVDYFYLSYPNTHT